jgi:polyisoprenoid-binding protein YceI
MSRLVFLLILLLIGQSAWAIGNIWSINTENSSVNFQLRNFMVAPIKGEFKSFSGRIDYDGQNLQNASVSAEIIVNSIDTGIPKRDLDLKKSGFFDLVHFPTITFKSKKIIPSDSGAFQIIGNLSMHGVIKPVTLNAEALKRTADSSGQIVLSTVATTVLNRKDFGIALGWIDQAGTWISDKVKVTLNIKLVPAG